MLHKNIKRLILNKFFRFILEINHVVSALIFKLIFTLAGYFFTGGVQAIDVIVTK